MPHDAKFDFTRDDAAAVAYAARLLGSPQDSNTMGENQRRANEGINLNYVWRLPEIAEKIRAHLDG